MTEALTRRRAQDLGKATIEAGGHDLPAAKGSRRPGKWIVVDSKRVPDELDHGRWRRPQSPAGYLGE